MKYLKNKLVVVILTSVIVAVGNYYHFDTSSIIPIISTVVGVG